MRIAIPTYKRSDKQLTLELLEKENYPKDKIYLFVEPREKDDYKQYGVNIVVLKASNGNMSMVNNQILDFMKSQQYLWVCDDVYEFKKVNGKKGNYWLYENCSFQELAEGVRTMLTGCVVVQIPTERRGVLKKSTKRWTMITNLHTCYFVNPGLLGSIRYDEKFKICEDYDFGYQLLSNGMGAIIDYRFTHNAKHWTNKGGCIGWRTKEMAKQTTIQFKKKYGDMVKTIFNKTSGMVEVRWKN